MSQYYKPQRTRNLYKPGATTPYRLSRSKIDLFIKCPRCFYLDRRLGVGQPPSFPFSLNSAVDKLLKKEFDLYRVKGEAHPLMKAAGVNAVPFKHAKMEEWRDSMRRGITYQMPETNLLVTGGVDDVWVMPTGELIIVDYKATAKDGEVNLDAEWQDGYKRQMEVYQWLFRKNNFKVSTTGYFVYCNGMADKEEFGGRLEFKIRLLPYKGDDSWVDGKILELYECLGGEKIPSAGEAVSDSQRHEALASCDYCAYVAAVNGKSAQGSLW